MSFFSKSRSRGHYPKHNHGSGYYKRSNGSGSILDKLLKALQSSRSHSSSFSDHHGGNYHNRHRRKSSWS
ncbi:MAG TPA: hypothetical protein VIO64_03050 [Pseudobacteroides sp.]|uniref:hypothetical protein n=1 Tax=Pseudobacteroides sp. TaxID=1968840 RepID=UPI002F937734